MKYYSQYGQDKFLDEKIFKGKKNGVFIEIGADDGITNSNSYFFERVRGWTGMCIEPRKKSFDSLVNNRSAICENCCVTNVECVEKKKFVDIEGGGGQLSGLIEKYDRRHLIRVEKVIGEKGLRDKTREVVCDNLNNLTKLHNLRDIDYCSIDTEGGELDILKSIDFHDLNIKVISVENNFKSNEINRFLKKSGYKRIAKISIDDIYARIDTEAYQYIYTGDYIKDIIKKIAHYPVRVKNFLFRKIKESLSEKNTIFIKRLIYRDYKDQYVEIKNILNEINIHNPTIVDGGAHEGQTIKKMKGYFSDSEIYAFEAIPELANKLKITEQTKVRVFSNALGEEEKKINFRINSNTATSSILAPDLVDKYHPGLAELCEEIAVDCVSLDDLLVREEIKQPDVIKLDLQGYELNALKGSKQVLVNCKVVLTEIEFVPLYKNQPLFEDVAMFMRQNDYMLYNLFDIQSDRSGQITFADAIFINKRFFK